MEKILIQKVRENDILYNAKSTFYRDTEMRQRTWEKIGKELNLKAEEARCMWDKLRRCFINARNRRRTKQNECGITIHPWKYERDMAFLWPFVERNRRTMDNMKSDRSWYENHDSESETTDMPLENGLHSIMDNIKTNSIDNIKAEVEEVADLGTSELYADDMLIASVETSMPTKRDYPQDDDSNDMLNNKRRCILQQNTLLEMDESDLFFVSMSKMTKTLPALQRAKIKLAVSNVVLQALINTHENTNPSETKSN